MTASEGHPRLRGATACAAAGYLVLLASLAFRHPVLLVIAIPLGAVLIVLGVGLWLRAVIAEARAKGML